METVDQLAIAAVLIGLGIVFILALHWLRVPLGRPSRSEAVRPPIPLELTQHSEAYLLVQSGGRVMEIDPHAREWFNAWEERPNLERLGRRTRPSETFLGLCAAAGQARFALDGRAIEGTSYDIPYGSGRAILVTLRRPQLVMEIGAARGSSDQAPAGASGQALSIFAELSRAMASSLELETTLQAILDAVQRLIPSDLSEANVWDAENRVLIPYRFISTPDLDRRLEKSSERYTTGAGYSGYLVSQRQPLLISDVNAFRQVRPIAERSQFPYQSYLGMPLEVAGELVGTVELASLTREGFSETDLAVLQTLAGQAAIALHNALTYQKEQRRATQLAGLARLAQVAGAQGEPQDLFTRLVETITPLLDVEILGFMLYDDNRRELVGESPFYGLHDDILIWAHFPIPPGSLAEQIWQAQELLSTSDAPNDPRLKAMGLDNLAVTAGIRHMALCPLSLGGHSLGYLLAADKRDGSAFDQADLRLAAIIAGQTAPIIENSELIRQSRRRAQRAETLRRIASLTASGATLDEILKYTLQDLARLLQADRAAIFLLDESRGELRVHRPSLFGVDSDSATRLGRISVDDPQYRATVTGSQQPFLSDDVTEDTRVLPIYRPLVLNLDVRSAIVAPLAARDQSIGELMMGSHRPNFFSRADMQSIITAAGQIAGAIERASLYTQTDQSLRRRVDQLTALARVSRELNSTLELERLLQRVFDEAINTTRADCGSILLFELRQETPDGPWETTRQVTLQLGDPSSGALHPLEERVLSSGETVVIEDFDEILSQAAAVLDDGAAAKSEELIEGSPAIKTPQPAHAGVRSAMIVPIAFQEQVAGLLHLHAAEPARFDATSREIAETLAIQAAIALGNALRYQEQKRRGELLNRQVDTLARLLETSQSLQLELPLETALENITDAIRAATPFEIVVASIYDPESECLLRSASAGLQPEDMAELRAHPQPWSALAAVFKPEYRVGRAYFIPYEQMPVMPPDVHTITVLPDARDPGANGRAGAAWHPEDILAIPLEDAKGNPLGLISVDSPRNKLRPDRAAIETLEIFASQAALVIESQNKLKRLSRQLEEKQQETRLASQAAENARNRLPVLLHKDLEQTLSIQRLSQRARRIQAGIDIAEIINRQGERTSVLQALGRELLARMDLDAALVVEPAEGGPQLLHSLGTIPHHVNVQALLGQRNPLHHSLQAGENIVVARLDSSSPWANAPLLQALEARAFVCLAILNATHAEAAVLAISRSPLPDFGEEDQQLLVLIARQVAITLQNLNLLTETSQRLGEVNLLLDFSRRLGGLDPASILEALAESAIHVAPSAHASTVSIWDSQVGALVPQAAQGYPKNTSLFGIRFPIEGNLPGQVFQSGRPVCLDEVDFTRQYNLLPEDLARYREATGGKLPVSSLAVPIQQSQQARPLGVVVLDNFQSPKAFNNDTQALIASLAQQTALHLEYTRLYRSAEERASQLQTLTRVAAAITAKLQPDELMATLLDELKAILAYDTGTLWLLTERQVVVRAVRGFADSDVRIGVTAALEDSTLLSEMIQTRQPIYVADVRQDARFPSLLEPERLSWLGLPLVASGEVTGVIALEKTEAGYYTPEQIQIATTFGGQAAVALENARLYQESLGRTLELNERSQRLEMLNRLSTGLSSTLELELILEITLSEMLRAIPCSRVSALTFDADAQASLRLELPAAATALPISLPDAPLYERLRQSLGVFNTIDCEQERDLLPLAAFLQERETRSLLVLPLATGSNLNGLLLVHSSEARRFSPDEVGLARTISNQAAIAVQNALLYAETRSFSVDLERRVHERTAQLAREHQATETLLRISTELTTSLDLEQVLNRTLVLVNQIVDAGQITVLIARPGDRKLHRLASIGYTEAVSIGGKPTPFNVDEGLAGWVLTRRQAALIEDVLEDPRWILLAQTPSPQHRSALAVPLLVGAEALGVLLLYHPEIGHFSKDQLDLVQAAANQVAVAINNAELYRLIRDQAEDLGSMYRSQQIEASRSRAILEAVADGVLVTDADRNITLFNVSAEKTLSLKRSQVIGNSLENFIGLFGRAGQDWMETILTWSQDPLAYQSTDLYAEQITLEDGRVVEVHLSPVHLKETFLGTVSVFRDITHEVELDRLKSEFVATVSHELRTPMTAIKGYVDVLLMGAAGEISSQQRHFIEIVKSNTERLAVLVNDLLDVSQIEAGRVTLSLQPLDLVELARKAVEELQHRSQADGKPMKIEIHPTAKALRVLGDIERVRQILDNLLENAYHYTPSGGRIAVQIKKNGDFIEVNVEDNGIGITPELQPRVFERFYRGEHPFVLATSGTGLGLSITQHLVEMHNGQIWLKSSGIPGEGSTFSFTLPVYHSNP